jgi:hypothetical protein
MRVFGSLRQFLDRGGSSQPFERIIPDEGLSAHDCAVQLGLPTEKIEAVFCNGKVINLYDQVLPGDRLAFAPFGTPGPYRVFLGMFREKKERERREKRR